MSGPVGGRIDGTGDEGVSTSMEALPSDPCPPPTPTAGPPPAASRRLRQDRVLVVGLAVAGVLGLLFAAGLPAFRLQAPLDWSADVGYVGAAAWCAGQAARRLRGHPARRFWLGMAVMCLLYFVGNVVQLVVVVRGATGLAAVQPNIGTQFLNGAGTLVLIGVMLSYPVPFSSRRAHLCFWLDMATVLAGAATFGAFFGLGTSVDMRHGVLDWSLSIITGPVLLLVAVFAITKLLLTGTAPFTREAGLFGASAAVALAGLSGLAPTLSSPAQQHWFFVVDCLASGLVFASARSQQVQLQVGSAALLGPHRRGYSTTPYIAVAGTYGLLIAALSARGLRGGDWSVVIGATVCTGLVIGRQLTAFAENHHLLAQRNELMAQLELLAYRDPLTGLANRAALFDRLEEELGPDARSDATVGVILLDLDDFKPINDLRGHHVGDAVLVAVAERIRGQVRESDLVARLGGDEFAVVLAGVDDQRLEETAGRIAAVVEQTVVVDGDGARVGCSYGTAVHCGGTTRAEDLLQAADLAMYRAKAARKSGRAPAHR